VIIIDRQIVILHVRKSGGTSFCGKLVELLPAERIEFYGYTQEGEERSRISSQSGGLGKHDGVRNYLDRAPADVVDPTIIVVSARSHIDRVASFYEFSKRRFAQGGLAYSWAQDLSFSEYLRSGHVNREQLSDFSTDASGKVAVQHIVPFEELDSRFQSLAAHLGFPNAKLPKKNVNRARELPYRSMFNDDDLAFTEELFAGEISFLKENQKLLTAWPF
jgi:hypothetical protein